VQRGDIPGLWQELDKLPDFPPEPAREAA